VRLIALLLTGLAQALLYFDCVYVVQDAKLCNIQWVFYFIVLLLDCAITATYHSLCSRTGSFADPQITERLRPGIQFWVRYEGGWVPHNLRTIFTSDTNPQAEPSAPVDNPLPNLPSGSSCPLLVRIRVSLPSYHLGVLRHEVRGKFWPDGGWPRIPQVLCVARNRRRCAGRTCIARAGVWRKRLSRQKEVR